MIEFAWPYIFLLAPLPYGVYALLPAKSANTQAALRIPDLRDFDAFKINTAASVPTFRILFAFLIWLALLCAAARPQWVGELVDIPQSGRDLMLAVDLSGSMQITDFEINGKQTDRLTALKLIASDFIDRRKGDRVGLILFGSRAYLQTPLTFDLTTVKQLLMEAEVGLAGGETAIGDAMGLAVKRLKDSSITSRVLVLLTDGNNNAGELSPEKAADLAEHAKLKVHTVAIGSNSMVVQTPFGPKTVKPTADIDEKTLKMVADKTGGKYFRAYNSQELAQIYSEIDQLEAIEQSGQQYRPTEEIYFWPLLVAFVCALLLVASKLNIFRSY